MNDPEIIKQLDKQIETLERRMERAKLLNARRRRPDPNFEQDSHMMTMWKGRLDHLKKLKDEETVGVKREKDLHAEYEDECKETADAETVNTENEPSLPSSDQTDS